MSLPLLRRRLFSGLAALMSLYVLWEVNYPTLTPQAQLALFGLLGLVLVFLHYPLRPALADRTWAQLLDLGLALATALAFTHVAAHNSQLFAPFWIDGQALGNRAGAETPIDYLVGLTGVLLVLEGARRAVGPALPLLSLAFLLYAGFGQHMPDWLFPHRGYSWERVVSQTFLHSQGVFGIALRVMFTYVFLFVLFGAVLEKTGATAYILDGARRLFRRSAGAPAKVAVLASGAMGSLSGSAVANTATTGTFTIPMMRSAGFKPTIAAGVEAAASSGGALVPPIMGAGAYMMLEIVEPAVDYLTIVKAALIPALLYYTALLLIVHFHAGRHLKAGASDEGLPAPPSKAQGLVFFAAFAVLVAVLLLGYTPFRAVSLSLILTLFLAAASPKTRLGPKALFEATQKAAAGGVALVAAAACVGLIIGVVTLTGIGAKLPGAILPLAQDNLFLALALLMVSTILLGMGLPSAVCYLLMATLVGPVLQQLGLVPLAAHFFIFYFGMMSMVTPPVALAAYTAAAIAATGVMATGLAAFRFALVGFALPYAFVLRPQLLLLDPAGGAANGFEVAALTAATLVGVLPLAAAITGYWFAPLNRWQQLLLLAAAASFFFAQPGPVLLPAAAAIILVGVLNRRRAALAQN